LYNVEAIEYTSAFHVALPRLRNIFVLCIVMRCSAEGTARNAFTCKKLPFLDGFTAIIATKCSSSALMLSYLIYANNDTLSTMKANHQMNK
jgi:hypothetical protein